MNISFRQIKAFLHVARLGNFTRAAEQMHVTQAGLSIMMRELESQLNCRLFDRTTRNVTLTTAGQEFLPVASRMVQELESSAQYLGELTDRANQTLNVGVTPLVASNVLPAACRMFRLMHPEVNIRLVDAIPAQVQHMVEGGELDFGLGAFFKPTSGVELVSLFEYQLMWVAPVDFDAPEGGPPPDAEVIPWSSLIDVPLMGLPPENRIQQVVEKHLAAIGRANEERLTLNNFETVIAMVSAGLGTAIVPSYANAACKRYGVRTAIINEPAASLSFYRITKRGRADAVLMPDFIDAFVSAVPAHTL